MKNTIQTILATLWVISVITLIALLATKPSPLLSSTSTINMEQGLIKNSQAENSLIASDCLHNAAMIKAKDIVDNDYWGHKNPTTGKNESWGYIDDLCGGYVFAGENLTKEYYNPDKAHKTLMESPGHRANIVNKNFNKIGVGCYKDVCVELFSD